MYILLIDNSGESVLLRADKVRPIVAEEWLRKGYTFGPCPHKPTHVDFDYTNEDSDWYHTDSELQNEVKTLRIHTLLDHDQNVQFNTLDGDLAFDMWLSSNGNVSFLNHDWEGDLPVMGEWIPATIKFTETLPKGSTVRFTEPLPMGKVERVNYQLTPEQIITAMYNGEYVWSPIERVREVHKINEGFDQKDALIHALDRGMINESEYDALYPIIMEEGLYTFCPDIEVKL